MVKIKIEENGNSEKGKLNLKDWKKILKGAGIATGGAILTYLLDLLPQINFGEYALVVVPIISVLINAGLKTLKSK